MKRPVRSALLNSALFNVIQQPAALVIRRHYFIVWRRQGKARAQCRINGGDRAAIPLHLHFHIQKLRIQSSGQFLAPLLGAYFCRQNRAPLSAKNCYRPSFARAVEIVASIFTTLGPATIGGWGLRQTSNEGAYNIVCTQRGLKNDNVNKFVEGKVRINFTIVSSISVLFFFGGGGDLEGVFLIRVYKQNRVFEVLPFHSFIGYV